MKISVKLFFAFLGLTSIVLVATLSLARWSFDQGFVNYINTLEQERLLNLAADLSEAYAQNGAQWSNLSQTQFNRIFRLNTPAKSPFNNRTPPRRPPMGENSLPSRGADNIGGRGQHGLPPHLRLDKGGPQRPMGPPTGLYSLTDELIAGLRIQHLKPESYVPVKFNNQIVAKLYSEPVKLHDSVSAQAFARQQLSTSLWIGFLCLLLAGFISWVLARVLLGPVKRVMKGISYLSSGNYSERFNSDGKDELTQLMRDIDQLAITLDKNRSAKNRWFADISHELRTPLSVLCGEIDAIKAGIRPFGQQQLISLEQEVMRIKHLVDDLFQLSLSDLGGLKYHFEPLDINQCIDNTLSTLSIKLAEQDLTLTFIPSTPLNIHGDKVRLEQMLANVILNSIAYTDSPGRIVIDTIVSGSNVIILVNDTKPSVSEAECEQLFEPLHRQDSSRLRRSNGAGLGLTICRNIVEAHSGTIQARPSNLGGICIEVILPLVRP